jgi:hypothetical protein
MAYVNNTHAVYCGIWHGRLFALCFGAMNIIELRRALKRHENLSELARRSGVNLRTLHRIKAGESNKVHPSTVIALTVAGLGK